VKVKVLGGRREGSSAPQHERGQRGRRTNANLSDGLQQRKRAPMAPFFFLELTDQRSDPSSRMLHQDERLDGCAVSRSLCDLLLSQLVERLAVDNTMSR